MYTHYTFICKYILIYIRSSVQAWKKACGDLQFARNAACRRCGALKPEDAGLTPAVSTPMAPRFKIDAVFVER